MTVPGVGPITAAAFIAVIDRPERFKKAASVAAYIGLTPRRYQSGEVDYSGRISKSGDAMLRACLYEAAVALLSRVERFSALKSWGVRLAARKRLQESGGRGGPQTRGDPLPDLGRCDQVPLEPGGHDGSSLAKLAHGSQGFRSCEWMRARRDGGRVISL